MIEPTAGGTTNKFTTLEFLLDPANSGASYMELGVTANGVRLSPGETFGSRTEYDLFPCQVADDDRPGSEILDVSAGGPQPCDAKHWDPTATFFYPVPADAQPGEEIYLLSRVYDWAGNLGGPELALTLVVAGDSWVGTVIGNAREFELGRPGSVKRTVAVQGEFSFSVTSVGSSVGAISGNGRATSQVSGGRDGDCSLERKQSPSVFDISVTGVHVGNAMTLQLNSAQEATVIETQRCPGLQPSVFTMSGLPWIFEMPEVAGMTLTTDGGAQTQRTMSETHQSEVTWRVNRPGAA